VKGVEVIPVALYEALDGTDTRDYVERVEPSAQGGRKMAELILRKIAEREGRGAAAAVKKGEAMNRA
jgi:hypothetical protein